MAKKKQERPRLIAEEGHWFRAEDYELARDRGRAYIRPAHGAKIKYYRPFDHFPEILEDYLELGRSVSLQGPNDADGFTHEDFSRWLKDRDKRNYDRIVAFARRYGLPGIFWQCGAREDWISQFKDGERVREEPKIFVPNSIWSTSLNDSLTYHAGYVEPREFLACFSLERFAFRHAYAFAPAVLKH